MNLQKTIFKEGLDNHIPIVVDHQSIKKAISKLKTLNHNFRIQILKLLDVNVKLTVTEIYVKLNMEQSITSQHLSVLRTAGLVNVYKQGKYVYYSINFEQLDYLNSIATYINNLNIELIVENYSTN